MTHYFTADEHKKWRDSQPQKMVVSKVIIRSPEGNVLLLKSAYKKSWQLPGGGVNTNESPAQAAVRETLEETGLVITEDELELKGIVYREDEEILFIIYALKRRIDEDAPIALQLSEVERSAFTAPSEAPHKVASYYKEALTEYLA